MSSKADATDQTTSSTTTQVLDRRAVLERGNQLLDNVFYSADDKVIRAAMGEFRAMLANMQAGQNVTISSMDKALGKVLDFANKGQVQVSAFAMQALEKARAELRDISDKGHDLVLLADKTTGQAMTMAQKVAEDQAKNQSIALEILADTKTGDFNDLTKSLAGMMMVFILAGLFILKKGE